jgi:hemerythrin
MSIVFMVFMPWTNELLTSVDKVDEQHKWLVDLTNRLHDEIIKSDAHSTSVGLALQELIDYTVKHFAMEEQLFKSLGYPDSEAHLAQHEAFIERITNLSERQVNGESVSVEMMSVLKTWLVHHIMKTDMAYVPFVKQHGVL